MVWPSSWSSWFSWSCRLCVLSDSSILLASFVVVALLLWFMLAFLISSVVLALRVVTASLVLLVWSVALPLLSWFSWSCRWFLSCLTRRSCWPRSSSLPCCFGHVRLPGLVGCVGLVGLAGLVRRPSLTRALFASSPPKARVLRQARRLSCTPRPILFRRCVGRCDCTLGVVIVLTVLVFLGMSVMVVLSCSPFWQASFVVFPSRCR